MRTHREFTSGVGFPEGFRRPALWPESECEGVLEFERQARSPDGHDLILVRCGLCGRNLVADLDLNCLVNEWGESRPIEVRPPAVRAVLDTMDLGAAGVSIERKIGRQFQERISKLEEALRRIVNYWGVGAASSEMMKDEFPTRSMDSLINVARLVLEEGNAVTNPTNGRQSEGS